MKKIIGSSKPETVNYSGGTFEKMKCSINLSEIGITPEMVDMTKGHFYQGKNGLLLFFDGNNNKNVGKFGETVTFSIWDKNATEGGSNTQSTQNTTAHVNTAQNSVQQASEPIEYPEEDINPEDIPF